MVSMLGSADAGLMGFESPSTMALRRDAAQDPDKRRRQFGRERLPMVFNYIPTHRFFEEVDGELIVTANRALPLVRYNIHDEGCLLGPVDGSGLPSVAVFGREKFAATLYGANIFADDVQNAMLEPEVASSVTGRFQLQTTATSPPIRWAIRCDGVFFHSLKNKLSPRYRP